MADTHNNPSDKLYINVAIALAVLTVISYIGDKVSLTQTALVILVLGVAVVKATLVCTFFMHLNFDWGKVKVMILAAVALSLVLVFALLPDICFDDRRDPMNDPALSAAVHSDAPPETAPEE